MTYIESGVIDHPHVRLSWVSQILKEIYLCMNGLSTRYLFPYLSRPAGKFVTIGFDQNRLASLQRLSCASDDVLCLSIDWSNRRCPTKCGQAFLEIICR